MPRTSECRSFDSDSSKGYASKSDISRAKPNGIENLSAILANKSSQNSNQDGSQDQQDIQV